APAWLALETTEEGLPLLIGEPLEEDLGEHEVELAVSDESGLVITQTFTVTVEEASVPLFAPEQSIETLEDTPYAGRLEPAGAEDEDATLTFVVAQAPEFGTALIDDPEAGDYLYTPEEDYAGSDLFTVEITDRDDVMTEVSIVVTVLPVNDPPRMELASAYTTTIGSTIEIPVVIADPEGDSYEVSIEGLPPGLDLFGDAITGVIDSGAEVDSPYLVTISATDAEGATSTATSEWIVVNAQSERDGVIEFSVVDTAQRMPGVQEFSAYAWRTPAEFGSCPEAAGVLSPLPEAGEVTVFEDVVVSSVDSAPALQFTLLVEQPGDYSVFVCGCAPTYVNDDAESPAAANDGVFVGLNDSPIVYPGTDSPAPIAGFAGSEDFVWQHDWQDPGTGESGPALVTVEEPGLQTFNLWMAADGFLVQGVRLVHASQLDVAAPDVGAACALAE
ncbi:MAG: hypothetical protein H3C34_16670, partial [Caldilineaceae bacterium]|nr:hypothetical protein [Caldilineaceae bacterium]